MTDNRTPDAGQLLALAERAEWMMKPDADLQYAIMTEVMGFRDIHSDRSLFDRGSDGYWTMLPTHRGRRLPNPTRSLDAAMTLIPEGMFLRLDTGRPQAILVQKHLRGWREVARSECALTTVGAVVSAALRAIAAIPKGAASND